MFHLLGLLLILWLGWMLIVGLWHVFVFVLSLLGVGIAFLFVADAHTRGIALTWIFCIGGAVLVMGLISGINNPKQKDNRDE